ncbi:hypothetical protein ACFQ08_25585, partial [Streptosporangium algeriense]
LASVTLPSGKAATEVTYDPETGRVAEYTDDNGGTWKLGTPTVYGGDADLRRGVDVRDPAGRLHLYEYDAIAGRMIRSGSPAGLGLRDEDRPGLPSPTPTPTPTYVCTTPDPGDPQFCTTIPPRSDGPVFEGHSADGIAIRTYGYDERGFQNEVTNENGDRVTMTHDDRGNVTSKRTCRVGSECQTEHYTYPTGQLSPFDPRADLPSESRDARSSGPADNRYRTTYTYTSTGELAVQTNPDGGTVRHTYTVGTEPAQGGGATPPGLLASTTDARGAVTRYSYHHNGDLAQITEPSGLTMTYTYDALGRKVSETEKSDAHPEGVTTTYAFDALSRPVTVTEPATTDAVTGTRHQGRTVNVYDVDGNLVRTEASDVLGGGEPRVTTYEYDDHNRVERVTDAEGGETSYTYDAFGNRTSMVDPGGNRYEYGYTARNMIAEVRLTDWDGDPADAPDTGGDLVLSSYAYDLAGRMARQNDAMGRRLEYAYYGDDLLKSVTLKNFHDPDGDTRDFVLQANTYDAAGHLTRQVTENGATVVEHTVDAAGQVTATVQDPGGLARRTQFGYDAGGNTVRVTTSGFPSNVPGPVPATSEVVDYAYDQAGNMVRETARLGTTQVVTTRTYDQRGLPTSTVEPRGNADGADKTAYTTTYEYDEMGRQVSVTGPPVAAESGGGAP